MHRLMPTFISSVAGVELEGEELDQGLPNRDLASAASGWSMHAHTAIVAAQAIRACSAPCQLEVGSTCSTHGLW